GHNTAMGSRSGITPTLSITAPVARTQHSAGTPLNVAWTLSNAPQGAEVRYLAQFPKDNQGGVISRIVTTPSYVWAIPTTLPSASYTILVKALVRADGKARIYQGEKVVQVQGSAAPVVTRVSPFDFNGDGCVDVGRDLLIFRERTNHCGAPPATCSVAGIEGAKNVLEWTTAFIDAVSAHPCQ
ncbi:MAG: VCBS repeat-containing protein, partial [bacterium]|nr:VCBS repeat-containing protein [bacterium]